MLWVMPAPATAVAPCEEKTQDKMTLSLWPPALGRGGGGGLKLGEPRAAPAPTGTSPATPLPATYLLGAGQGEEQVQCCLGEVQVLLHAKAHLQGGEEGRQDGEPAGHLQPRVPVLIHLTQLLGQVQAQDTDLLGPGAETVRGKEAVPGEKERKRPPMPHGVKVSSPLTVQLHSPPKWSLLLSRSSLLCSSAQWLFTLMAMSHPE